MEHTIHGTTMPVLEMDLQPGESIVSEAGELSWMSSSIELETSTQKAGGGGLFGAVKRAASGGSLFMTEYTAKGAAGSVAFAARLPGAILPINVSNNQTYMVHTHGFLCGTPDVELTIGFQQSLGAGVFGGEGFRLQKVSGNGQAWIELSGEIVTYDLKPGETLRVHPGHVGMFEAGVSFEITRIKGIKNLIFGADGIFLAALTGPGKIWLQSLTLVNLAHSIQPYLTVNEAATGGVAGAVAGGLLKGFGK